MKRFLPAGRVVATHGVRGEVKVYPDCDSSKMFVSFPKLFYDAGGEHEVDVESKRVFGRMVLLKISRLDTVEAVRKLINKSLFFDRNDVKLEKGRHFIQDLLRCRVVDADSGKDYGEIADVTSNGAHDVYHISMNSGELRFLPVVPEFVVDIDANDGRKTIKVRPIPGMLED